MRRGRMWSAAVAGLALGSLGMVGGTVVGGELGPMAVGYGLLIALSALYLAAGLTIRERAWQRLARHDGTAAHPDRLAGRRVF
jgi:sulfite exporter TauE/SafE